MTIWIKKRFAPPVIWANTDLMDRAEQLIMRFPYQFMMVEDQHAPLDSTIWVRLPDPALRTLFPEFCDGQIGDLIERPITLVAEAGEYDRAFGALPSRR